MPVTSLTLSKVVRSPSLQSEFSSNLSDSKFSSNLPDFKLSSSLSDSKLSSSLSDSKLSSNLSDSKLSDSKLSDSKLSSSPADNRHVSFNQDVSVKRIPKKPLKQTRSAPLNQTDEFSGVCNEFVNIPPPSDRDKIALEAEQILKQLQEIECSASPVPQFKTRPRILSSSPQGRLFSSNPQLNNRSTTPLGTATPLGSRQSTLERKPTLGNRLSKSSNDLLDRGSAMRVEGHSEQEDGSSPADNRLYGLQALSKLDNALNGKVSNLYRDSSGSSYSPPPKKNNFTPPKPPRKAPSASPPATRKGYASLDELEFGSRRSNIYEEEREDPRYNMDYTNSYTSTNPALNHLRGFSPASRQSPSRGNHTDSEILSSPSQVLYATISADKNKHHNPKNQHIVHSASQTVQSGFRPVSVDRQMKPRTLSKENILDEAPYRYNNNGSAPHHASRSLERFVDSDKENRRQELKARIHVTSPHRFTPDRQQQAARKPYKTTINTANDTIQYRGFSQDLARKAEERKQQFLHSGKRLDNEHYKVPKNKAPVPPEFLSRRAKRGEGEGSGHNGNYHNPGGGRQNQFASTSLVRNAESRQKGVGEYDREGRRIRSERSGERTRAYSGYSTSPDRELSPDRYIKHRGGSKSVHPSPRSPSSSPTRPPRTRATSAGEINIPVRREHSARRVERTPSTRAAATSRSPIKKIQRVHNEIQSDQPGTLQRDPRRPVREPGTSRPTSKEHPSGSRTLTLSRERGDKAAGVRATKTLLVGRKEPKPKLEDRLSKFTEYRGGGGGEQEETRQHGKAEQEVTEPRYRNRPGDQEVPETRYRSRAGDKEPARVYRGEQEGSRTTGRRSSHSVGERSDAASDRENYERERGQSVPPGANIDTMRDFYKTSQYRSMYHLPPSPSRPAPVLDRSTKPTTLERSMRRERSGDLNLPPRRISKTSMSEGELTDDVAKAERVLRQRNNFINNLAAKNGENARRAGSNDREDPRRVFRGGEVRRVAGGSREREKRPAPQPPTQRIRRSSVDVLETSLSESESPRQEKAKSEGIGGGWMTGQSDADRRSDIDTDYRRELVNSVHSEARGRDGGRRDAGGPPPSIYKQAASLTRREIEISQDDEEEEVVRSPTSLAREEERRKILELEEDRRRKGTGAVSRSTSRVNKIIGLKSKPKVAETTENESQYSGHSTSSLRKDQVRSRLNNGQPRTVKRTASSATRSTSGGRRKLPSSLTSSINSSESEHGSGRGTTVSGQSNRSVYLHATAVADIPANTTKHPPAVDSAASNLKNSKKISRSISLLTPFKPKQSAKEKEVVYDSAGNQVQHSGKPPRPPPQPSRRVQPPTMTKEKKFASSSDLLRDEGVVVVAPLQEPKPVSSKVSRSVSMPKDTRLAGWFKKRKRV